LGLVAAALIGGGILFERCLPVRLPRRVTRTASVVGKCFVIGFGAVMVAVMIWQLGGEALHKLFHYCTG
jgi:hypothetical protein